MRFWRHVLCLLLLVAGIQAHAGTLPESAPSEEASSAAQAPAQPIAVEQDAGADQRIAARLSDIFGNVPSLSNVTPAVAGGVVTLTGTAPDQAALDRAEAIASGVDGVVTVENNIERDVSVNLDGQVGGLGEKFQQAIKMLPLIGAALLVALVIAGIGYLIASLGSLWHRIAPNSFLAELIASAIRFAFVVGGIVVALDMIGATALLGAVLGGAGVIGIALGFAMRDTIENYVASLMLSLRQPFRANDHVVIDTQEGRVIRLTSRATVLMTLDGNHLRIPNSTVFKATILNFTRNPQRRFDFELGIDADDDPDAGRRTGRAALAELPFVLDDPAPEARVTQVGDSNIVIQFLGWIDQTQADWHKAKSRSIAHVKKALEDAGFALPEPIYRLRFDPRGAPLPFANVDEASVAETKPAPSPSPAPSIPQTQEDNDVRPDKEVERMVDEERAKGTQGQEKDLLDHSTPVE